MIGTQKRKLSFPSLNISVKCPYQPAATSFVLDGCCHVLYDKLHLSFSEARTYCWKNHGGQFGSDLAVPLSLVSLYNELQRKGVGPATALWVGALSTATTNWRWVDGRPVHCHYIISRRKDMCGFFIHLNEYLGKKHVILDINCATQLGFICQMQKYQN
ncbi:uncharacterized protein LOC126982230 [Eriocheir sinensis]|uniref:uncharacterized protein LOC126982230 n=1 Tax=Eriocheir sinensis TaxID=95602 RepID=UPI0021C89ED7|nr:uncharacterized protein LOC126982230 [Eriocheir sinensis]